MITLEHIVALTVRLFAIVLGLFATREAVSMLPYVYEQGWHDITYLYASFSIFMVVAAIFLWYFPITITRGLIKFKEPGKTEINSATAEEVQIVGLSVLGIYLLFHVMSDIFYWGYIWLVSQRSTEIHMQLTNEQVGSIVATIVELFFVLFLLLGTKRVVGLLHTLRYGKG